MKRFMLALMIAAAAGCAATTEPKPDSLARFHGLCSINVEGNITVGACRSEDLTAPGFTNRFHLVIQTMWGTFRPMTPIYQPVTVTALPDGSMLLAFPKMSITVTPLDQNVREAMAQAAPGSETRSQLVSIQETHAGVFRIYIEEPAAAASN